MVHQRNRRGSREEASDLIDRVVSINRVAKVVKGGRRFNFSALIVVGDGKGRVGAALGKASEVPEAIRKGREKASREMKLVPIINDTIPHEVVGCYGAGRVLLKPASPGTGVIAGGPVRAVLEAAGVGNILTKCIGSNNPHNVIHATMQALSELTSLEEVAMRRGLSLEEISKRFEGK